MMKFCILLQLMLYFTGQAMALKRTKRSPEGGRFLMKQLIRCAKIINNNQRDSKPEEDV